MIILAHLHLHSPMQSILYPKIYSHAKPAASSHRQLFSASSVNVRSKVHFEIMEHVTFFSVSRRYCSQGIGAFWMRGCTEDGEGSGGSGSGSGGRGEEKPWGRRRNVTTASGAGPSVDIDLSLQGFEGKKDKMLKNPTQLSDYGCTLENGAGSWGGVGGGEE